jgi:hypothetical protein
MIRRPLAVAAIVAAIAAPMVTDRFVDRPTPASPPVARVVNPSASAAASGTSTWFCASGRTTTEGQPDLTVTIANANDIDVPGRISWFGEEVGRPPVIQPLLVAANSRTDVVAPAAAGGGAIAALVEFEAGAIAAEHRISGPQGGAEALCASDAGSRWMTADGSTTIDSTTTLSVFNPFPEDALLDVRFVTDRGAALPAALQGMSIPARSVQRIEVGDYVRRRQRVAAIVSARTGRVVVERTTTFDGSGANKGTTISPASSTPSPTWYFAAGGVSAIRRERYSLFNPSRRAVTAVIDVLIDGVAGVEPFEIDVPPLGLAELTPRSESRIPRGVGYSVVVSTDDATPIVVERTIDAAGRLRRGYSSSPGIVAPSERWIIPDVETSSDRTDDVSLLNPTDTNAVVSLQSVGPDGLVSIEGTQNVLVGPSARLDVRLGDYMDVKDKSLVIASPGTPIIVEHTRQRVDKAGARPVVAPLPGPISSASVPVPPSVTTSSTTSQTTVAAPAHLALVSPATTTVGAPSTGAAPPTSVLATTTTTTTTTTTPTTTTTTRTPTIPAAPGSRPAVTPRIGQAATGLSVGGAIPAP